MLFLLFSTVALAQWIQGPCSSETQIKRNEGYYTTVYKDSGGKNHICYGFNLDQAGASTALANAGAPSRSTLLAGGSISQSVCLELLEAEMIRASQCAEDYVNNFNSLSLSQQSALVDMAYNLGCAGLGQFVQLRAAVERRDFATAANEIADSSYCSQVGCRCSANRLCMNNCWSFPSNCQSRYPAGVPSCGPAPSPPPVAPCTYSTWAPIGSCSAQCDDVGVQTYTRTKSSASCTGTTTTSMSCDGPPCPASACTYGQWSPIGACNAPCDGVGEQQHTRTKSASTCTGATVDYKTCYGAPCGAGPTPMPNVLPTPVPSVQSCVYGSWLPVGTCNAPCGGSGVQYLERTKSPSSCSGSTASQQICYGEPCPVACTYSAWTPSTVCSAPCGGTGTITERRSASDTSCLEPLVRSVDCAGAPCPANCAYSEWFDSSACGAACGENGSKMQSRLPTTGDARCTATTRTVQCVGAPCVANCKYSSWRTTTPCDAACGKSGQMVQSRSLTSGTTASCSEPLMQALQCVGQPCAGSGSGSPAPVNCQWAAYGPFDQCSATCGAGTKTRQRGYAVQPAFGGAPCVGSPFETVECSVPCGDTSQCTAIDCVLSEWTPWSTCMVFSAKKRANDCFGSQTRKRSVIAKADCNGRCSATAEEKYCDAPECLTFPGYVPVGENGAIITGQRNNGGSVTPGGNGNGNNGSGNNAGNYKGQTDANGNPLGGFDANGNPIALVVRTGEGAESGNGLSTAAIAGIAAGGVICCLLICALVICVGVALLAGDKSPPAQSGEVYKPEGDAIVANNPLFANAENKMYSPIFYAAGSGSAAPIVAPNSGNYAAAVASAGYGSMRGESYGDKDARFMSAREEPGMSGVYAAGAGGYEAANTCVLCNQAYPTAADLNVHVQKRHAGNEAAAYPSAAAQNYPSGGTMYNVSATLPRDGSNASFYPVANVNYPSGAAPATAIAGAAYPGNNAAYPSAVGGAAYPGNTMAYPGNTIANYGGGGGYSGEVHTCPHCQKNYPTSADLATHISLRHVA